MREGLRPSPTYMVPLFYPLRAGSPPTGGSYPHGDQIPGLDVLFASFAILARDAFQKLRTAIALLPRTHSRSDSEKQPQVRTISSVIDTVSLPATGGKSLPQIIRSGP